ncbi:MAG: hypothetical protein J6S57_01585 [Alphaproteobacteria bacterium]|nr:hypothetical protein [Alphaproteobacteria bacterium]
MLAGINILAIVKYAAAIILLICIILAPAYLAAVNECEKYDKMRVRCGVLLLGWTIIGWLFALFLSSKK